MSNTIIELEKGLFSNLQSEFYKFINSLENDSVCKKTHISEKIILLNEQMRLLENMLYELKIDIYSNNSIRSKLVTNQLTDYDKDKKVIEKFKPFMLYYRFMLE